MRTLPIIALALLLTGCALDYRGTSPTLRSFNEDPTVQQTYMGVDLEFAIVDPPKSDGDRQPVADPQAPQEPDRLPKPLPPPPFGN